VIVAVGIDLVEIERVAELVSRFEGSGRGRVFTKRELSLAGPASRRRDETLAARFAAKEATMKALGRGLGQGLGFADIELLRGPRGAPLLVLHGGAADRAKSLGATRLHVSMTHSRETACAVVVLESGAVATPGRTSPKRSRRPLARPPTKKSKRKSQ
jgi:holo-[acyl-carrier protein] synthase